MKKLLIYTAASGIYLDYAPLFTYMVKSQYPEYDVDVTKIVSPPATYSAACYRLLVNPAEMTGHEYVYITDVDMMILREEPGILEFHTAEMESTGLCYSNSIRKKHSEPQGDDRMTGLHFATAEWYRRTQDVRSRYFHAVDSGEFGNGRFDDELILKSVCEKSGVGIPRRFPLIARHHGIHLGTIRGYINHTRETMKHQLRYRINPAKARQWITMHEDKRFREICRLTAEKNRVIGKELEILYTFCMGLRNEK